MRLKENVTVSEFLKQIQLCRGNVEFRTPEGDCLNLKSEMSKYLFAAVWEKQELIGKGILICKDENDRKFLSSLFEQI